MAYTNTGGALDSSGYQLGIFLVKAHYTVRGRRAIPLSATVRADDLTGKGGIQESLGGSRAPAHLVREVTLKCSQNLMNLMNKG
jgi:hypothetical protein